MKKKLLFILPIFCLCLSSCFDIEENYNLKANGSYELSYQVDMGGMLKMVNSLLPDSLRQDALYQVSRDTIFNLANIPDSLRYKFNEMDFRMLADTKMRSQMNLKDGEFKIVVVNTGKSIAELKYYLNNFNATLKKSGGLMDRLLQPTATSPIAISMQPPPGAQIADKTATDMISPVVNPDAEFPFDHQEYDYIITPTTFERKIKADALAAAKEKKLGIYEMLKGMDIKITNTITINLPRAAKSIENTKAVLSADKKQFVLKIDLLEAVLHPELLNFKINY